MLRPSLTRRKAAEYTKKIKQMFDEPHVLYDSRTHWKCTRRTLEDVPAWPAHSKPAVG